MWTDVDACEFAPGTRTRVSTAAGFSLFRGKAALYSVPTNQAGARWTENVRKRESISVCRLPMDDEVLLSVLRCQLTY